MPTSNGLVTSRDIRQDAVKRLHVVPAAIGTTELDDLAVTVAKNNTVLDWERDLDQTTNFSITTSFAVATTVDIVVPTWATEMALSASVSFQATITVDTTFLSNITLNGREPITGRTFELAATGTRHTTFTEFHEETVTSGSTVTVDYWVRTFSGSNSANAVIMWVLALFRR